MYFISIKYLIFWWFAVAWHLTLCTDALIYLNLHVFTYNLHQLSLSMLSVPYLVIFSDVIDFYIFRLSILPLIFTLWCLSLQDITYLLDLFTSLLSFLSLLLQGRGRRRQYAPDRWAISWDSEADTGFRTSWSISLGSLCMVPVSFLPSASWHPYFEAHFCV